MPAEKNCPELQFLFYSYLLFTRKKIVFVYLKIYIIHLCYFFAHILTLNYKKYIIQDKAKL